MSETPAPTPTTSTDDAVPQDLAEPVREAADWALHVSPYPTVPARIGELMILSVGTEPAFREIDRLVRADPMLAARVLSAANSALYGSSTPVTSLRAAFLRLGWNSLRSILLQAVAELHLFAQGPRAEVAAARTHAVAVAHIHRLLAQTLGLDAEHAFACGLLHDLGTGILLNLFASADRPPMTDGVRRQAIHAIHEIVGARQCRTWGLPEVLGEMCRFHHQQEVPASVQRIGLASLASSEAVADGLGLGCNGKSEDSARWLGALPLDTGAKEAFLEASKNLCSDGL